MPYFFVFFLMRSRAIPVSNWSSAICLPKGDQKVLILDPIWTRQKKYRRSKSPPFLDRFLCIFGPPFSHFSSVFDSKKITSLNGLLNARGKKYSVPKKIQRQKKNKKIYRRSKILLFLSQFSIKIGVTGGPGGLQNGAANRGKFTVKLLLQEL